MLVILAYDITHPKRLGRVAELCELYGQRAQYSVFECHLEAADLDEFWAALEDEIDADEDRVVAHTLDAKSASKTRTAGEMVRATQSICDLV